MHDHAVPKAWDNKTGNNLLNAIHDFLVWLIVLIQQILNGFKDNLKIILPYLDQTMAELLFIDVGLILSFIDLSFVIKLAFICIFDYNSP